MHSIMMVLVGLITLAVFAYAGYARGKAPGLQRAIQFFVPVWLIVSIANLLVGVLSAGYTVMQEMPFLLVVFGVPALAAWALRLWARKSA